MVSKTLIAQIEERFLLPLLSRKPERPAKRSAKLVLLEGGHLGQERVGRIECGVSNKLSGSAVEMGRAGLGHDVNNPAEHASE